MLYINEFYRDSQRFKVCDADTGKSKLFTYNELLSFVKNGNEVYGVTDTVWFVPVSGTKNSDTELVFTFDIMNINDSWRRLVPSIEDDFFRVDVVVTSNGVSRVEFYYTYSSNDVFDITNNVDLYFNQYIQFYATGLYLRCMKVRHKSKDYGLVAQQYAEAHGVVKYRVKGNEMIYNVSYQAYLSNPRYTIQHTVNLDTGEEYTKQLKRFDASGLQNRG